MGYYDITGVDFEDFPAEWANYYEYEPEEEYYGPTEEWKPACPKRESYQSHTDKLCPTAIHANGFGTVDQLASNSDTLGETSDKKQHRVHLLNYRVHFQVLF